MFKCDIHKFETHSLLMFNAHIAEVPHADQVGFTCPLCGNDNFYDNQPTDKTEYQCRYCIYVKKIHAHEITLPLHVLSDDPLDGL
jgi:predicted RNA-binding Zn-ribbon protein involved in translation (DUF1610 family)